MKKNHIWTVLLILCINKQSEAQIFESAYISPGISLGYCFTAKGFSFGLECDLGLKKTTNNGKPFNYGINLSKSWTNVNQKREHHNHRHTSINILIESTNFDFKVGYGIAKNPWGYLNRNQCIVNGVNFDLGLTTRKKNYPWIGFKSFYYKRRDWRWLDKPYYTSYVKYKYDKSGLSK